MINQIYTDSQDLVVDLAAAALSGAPVLFGGTIPGVLALDTPTSAPFNAVLKTRGVYNLAYTVAGAVAAGGILFLDTGIMGDVDGDTTGLTFGYAQAAIGGAGSGFINVILANGL